MSGYLTRDASMKHYGVPGMRWGHRKSNSGTGSSDAPRRYGPAVVKTAKIAGKVVRTTGKIALKTGIAVAAASVGAYGLSTIIQMESAHPGTIGVGRDEVRLQLDKMGLINLNALDKAEIYKDRGVYNLREYAGRK